MKTTFQWMLMGLVSLLTVGCGDAGLRSLPPAPKAPAPTSVTPTQTVPTTQAELRIQGDDAQGEHVLLRVTQAEVTLYGRRLLVTQPRQDVLDLGNTDQAWLLGTFQVPSTVDTVHVRLSFDDFGGYEGPAGAGALDTRTRAIEFDAPVSSLALRGHAVVHLNLARSIVPEGSGRGLLLPVVKVEY